MRSLPDIVKAIALNNKIDESRDFASMVQASMHDQLRKADRNARNLGVKQAPFMVLDRRDDAERARGGLVPDATAQEATLLRDRATASRSPRRCSRAS